jgi:hypothetical protein
MYRCVGLAAILSSFFSLGCAARRAPGPIEPNVEYVIPHACIVSDVVCRRTPKEDICKFEQFKSCVQVRVVK